jgi:hypothetical protein
MQSLCSAAEGYVYRKTNNARRIVGVLVELSSDKLAANEIQQKRPTFRLSTSGGRG